MWNGRDSDSVVKSRLPRIVRFSFEQSKGLMSLDGILVLVLLELNTDFVVLVVLVLELDSTDSADRALTIESDSTLLDLAFYISNIASPRIRATTYAIPGCSSKCSK